MPEETDERLNVPQATFDAVVEQRNQALRELEAARQVKALADGAIVDQHEHIIQLQQLLKRYIS